MSVGSFEVESLMADARAQTGLSDFGSDPWREALTMLASSLDREANLHAIGRSVQRQRLVESLAVRLTFLEACNFGLSRERIERACPSYRARFVA